MEQKFIINNGELLIGDVEYHKELVRRDMNEFDTIGGGRWFFKKTSKKGYFYGLSKDFGRVNEGQFVDALKNSSEHDYLLDWEIYWSTEEYIPNDESGWKKLNFK